MYGLKGSLLRMKRVKRQEVVAKQITVTMFDRSLYTHDAKFPNCVLDIVKGVPVSDIAYQIL